MPAVGKKLHHFVSRFYLRGWAANDSIFCLSAGNIYSTNVRNAAAENYFYRLVELTPFELALVGKFIDESPEPLRETHRELLRIHMAPFVWRHVLEQNGGTPEQFAWIERQILELNENLQTHIEDVFNPFLTSLREGDLTFFECPESRAKFYGGFSVQYARTKFLDAAQKVMTSERFETYERTSTILVQIIALNVGASLFGDAANRTPYLLQNDSTIPFVTADQPIINLVARPKGYELVDRFDCYFPVSPTRALLLLEPNSLFTPKNLALCDAEVRQYNLKIAAHSNRQVFSNSETELSELRAELPL